MPHEWEWQYAAQGTDGRTYPWGSSWDSSAVPATDTNRSVTSPSDVTAFPKSASPYGVLNMVGNVWQWTDEFMDEHTRAAILRGGVTINRKAQAGTSRKPIRTTSMANTCLWPLVATAPQPSVSAA